jgi:hypothetical protein
MEIRKLISKFLTNIFEKNYSEADKDIKAIVEAKVTEKIKKTSKEVEEKSSGKKENPFKKGKSDKKDKPAKKGKLSKEENKKRFMEMIAKKKGKNNSKKGSK